MADDSFKVDLDNISLVDEEVYIDPSANPFEGPPPPPDGIHLFKLKIVPDSWESRETKKGEKRKYLVCRVQGNVLAEGKPYNNRTFFDSFVSTLVFEGRSRMAGILKALGQFVPERIGFVELAKTFRSAMAGEPSAWVRGQWQAQRKETVNGEDVYTVFARGMKNFPPDGKGGYLPSIHDRKTDTDCQAQWIPLEYLSREEYAKRASASA